MTVEKGEEGRDGTKVRKSSCSFRLSSTHNKKDFRSDLEVFSSLGIDLWLDAHRVFDGIEIIESVQSRRKQD